MNNRGSCSKFTEIRTDKKPYPRVIIDYKSNEEEYQFADICTPIDRFGGVPCPNVSEYFFWGKVKSMKYVELKDKKGTLIEMIEKGDSMLVFVDLDKSLNLDHAENDYIAVHGEIDFDSAVDEDFFLYADSIICVNICRVADFASIKRSEISTYTNYSLGRGTCSITDLFYRAKEFGHKALALTDMQNTRSFPELMEIIIEENKRADLSENIKLIFGVSIMVVDMDGLLSGGYEVKVLAKNKDGLRNLNQLVSTSIYEASKGMAGVNWDVLSSLRENLLIGSSANNGEVIEAFVRNEPIGIKYNIISKFDYVELGPIETYYTIFSGDRVKSIDSFKVKLRELVDLAHQINVPVVASGSVTSLNPGIHYQKGEYNLTHTISADSYHGENYYRTTAEMLDSFNYLERKNVREIAIDNSIKIANSIDRISIPESKFNLPNSKGSLEKVKHIVVDMFETEFGCPLSPYITSELEKELLRVENETSATLYLSLSRLIHHFHKKSIPLNCLIQRKIDDEWTNEYSLITHGLGLCSINSLPEYLKCNECGYFLTFHDLEDDNLNINKMNCPRCYSKLVSGGLKYSIKDYEIPEFNNEFVRITLNCKVGDRSLIFENLNKFVLSEFNGCIKTNYALLEGQKFDYLALGDYDIEYERDVYEMEEDDTNYMFLIDPSEDIFDYMVIERTNKDNVRAHYEFDDMKKFFLFIRVVETKSFSDLSQHTFNELIQNQSILSLAYSNDALNLIEHSEYSSGLLGVLPSEISYANFNLQGKVTINKYWKFVSLASGGCAEVAKELFNKNCLKINGYNDYNIEVIKGLLLKNMSIIDVFRKGTLFVYNDEMKDYKLLPTGDEDINPRRMTKKTLLLQNSLEFMFECLTKSWIKIYKPLHFYSNYFNCVDIEQVKIVFGGRYNPGDRIHYMEFDFDKKLHENIIQREIYYIQQEMRLRSIKILKPDILKSDIELFLVENDSIRMPLSMDVYE